MKSIPQLLLILRFILALVIFSFAISNSLELSWLVISLMYLGILSDVFDGIIARNTQIVTDKFRIQDTLVDMVFYSAIFVYIILLNPAPIVENRLLILLILGLEAVMYFTCIARFKKLPSPHAILSKFWAIYLVIEFTLLILEVSGIHFEIALWVGLFVHIDRVLIYVLLKDWERDVPSSLHALRLRQGKRIKRWSLFN